MHGAYKQLNGLVTKREPAYLYSTGTHLVAVWAPALEPSDATDSRFRDLIADGDEFKINDLSLRNAQHFSKGFLIDRWTKIEKNRRKRERIARETAMNALHRRPFQIAELALKTYLGYWSVGSIKGYAREDLGNGVLTDQEVNRIAEKFRFRTGQTVPTQPFSLSQQYFLAAWPYYFIIIVSPVTCAFATWLARDRAFAFLLFVHASILVLVVTALSPQASIRYLHPLSVLTLLSIGICVDCFARKAKATATQSAC
jgi:hypothetical protein